MSEMKALPNRKWVIKVAIGFLAVMLILTFFSNTIMNYSLPQVKVVYSSPGSMSTTVQGTGTLEAITSSKLIAQGTREIGAVNCSVYDQVTAGTLLATYAPATDEQKADLKAAQDALDALLKAKVQEDLQYEAPDYTMLERSVADAQKALDEANRTLSAAQGKAAAVNSAQAEVNAAQGNLNAINADIETISGSKASKEAEKSQLESIITEKLANGEDTTAAQALLDQANADLASLKQQLADKNGALSAAQTAYSAASAKLSIAQSLPEVAEAQTQVDLAKRNLGDQQKALDDAKKKDAIQAQINAMSEEDKKKAIDEAQKKVDDLTKVMEQVDIVAPKDGTVSEVSIVPGSTTAKGDVMIKIDVTADGYKSTVPFTTAQASQMSVGMTVTADYQDDAATIASIKPDPTNPKNSKNVTFIMNNTEQMYWYTSGTQVNFSIESRSKNYECMIPLSAVHEESGETFVYAMKTQSSPLGDRYIAVKVVVQILGKDASNAAIDPSALGSYGSAVITESNDKSFKSGDQVRLVEGL